MECYERCVWRSPFEPTSRSSVSMFVNAAADAGPSRWLILMWVFTGVIVSNFSQSGSSDDNVADDRMVRRVQKVAENRAKHLAKELRGKGGIAGYTDSDNPFGDSNLTERFVWGKKIQKEVQKGKSERDFSIRSQRET